MVEPRQAAALCLRSPARSWDLPHRWDAGPDPDRFALQGFGQDAHHPCCPGTPALSPFAASLCSPPFLFLVSGVLAASPSLSEVFSPGLELLL